MLFRLLAFLRYPRATDFVHLLAKLDRLQTELEAVRDGFQRGTITLEDLTEE
jgi:hypothetical protein